MSAPGQKQFGRPSQEDNRARKVHPPKQPWEIQTKKPYFVFDFTKEKPKSLLAVPCTWVIDDKECWWPTAGSEDERKVASLIRQYSSPNSAEWSKLPGRVKKKFDNFTDAQKYISKKNKTATDTDNDTAKTSTALEKGASHSDSSNPQPSVSEFHSQAEIASRPSFAAEVADSPPTLSSIMESLAELHVKVDKIQEQLSKGPSIPLKEKVVAVDAQETLKNDFKLPSTALDQFYELEEKIQGEANELRGRLRRALIHLSPKPGRNGSGSEAIYPMPIMVARSVCRSIGGDELFQFFTREQLTRAKGNRAIQKIVIQQRLPNISRVITAVIVHSSNTDLDTALSAFGKHLAKCPDRAKSKALRADFAEPAEPSAKTLRVDESFSSDSD